MSDIRNKVLLYRTNTSGVSASADSIQHGELAMNFNAETPFLMFKDTEDNIVKIGTMTNFLGESEFKSMSQKGVTDALKLPENYVSVEYPEVDSTSFTKTESGTVIYDAIKQIDQNVATLVQEVLDDEEVVAAAITSINNSSGFDANCKYNAPLESSTLSGASSLYEADLLLSGKIDIIEESLNNIEVGISDSYSSVTYPTLDGDEQFTSIVSGDSLDSAAKKLEENIITLTNEVNDKIDGVIKGVNVNEVSGIVNENKIVEISLDGKDISLTSEYESVEYPIITDGSVVFSAVTSGMTIEDAIKQVDTTVSQLVNEVLKDEKVVAAAITQINNSCGFNINCEYTPYTESEVLSAATSLHEADNLLENRIYNIEDNFDALSANSLSNILINEKEGIVENNIASLNLNGSEIKLSSEYVAIEYPEIDEDVVFTAVTAEQTVDDAIKQLDSSISQLVNEVLKDEQVISNTLTVHNESSGFDINGKYINNQDAYFIFDAYSLTQADIILDEAIYSLSATTSGLSSNLTNQVNTIQNNLNTVSGNVNSLSATVTSHTTSITNLNNQIANITTDINVNGVSSTTVNKVATVTISGSNIPLSSNYSEVTYPETVTAEFSAVTSSMTVENAINQLDTTIAQVVNEIIKDEKVIAAAMMKQNSSCGFDENANYIPYSSSSIISAATSLAEADEMISDKLEVISNIANNGINGININNIGGNIDETSKIASLTLGASDIKLSDTYEQVVYPTVSSTIFNAVSASSSIEESIKQIDSTVAQLVQEMLNNEDVIASVITKHNESCGLNENAEYAQITSATYINAASNLSDADVLLDSAISNVENRISTLESSISNISVALSTSYTPVTYEQVGEGDNDPDSAMVSNAVGNNLDTIVSTLESNLNILAAEINENEYVAASALTDLNNRVETLETEVATIKTQLTSILSRLDALENPTE